MGTWSYTYDDFNRLTGGTATAGVDDVLTLGRMHWKQCHRSAHESAILLPHNL
jgi:hypothetical protein